MQDYSRANLAASRGVAVREFILTPPHGRADYLLFVDGQAVGVLEAKKEGETLTGVAWQTAKYVDGIPDGVPTALEGALPFAYQSTGTETRFTNALDPEPTSRDVFSFHKPETLAAWIEEVSREPEAPTLRHRLTQAAAARRSEPLAGAAARRSANLERSLAENRPRALVQMATGSGKTYTAASLAYRLIKHGGARRVLFLVDRANLGRQTLKEFQGFTVPDVEPEVHRALQRPAPRGQRHRPGRARHDLDDPAPLLDAPRRRRARPRARRALGRTRSSPTSPSRSSTTRPSRRRRSTSSSSTSATARSSASGGRCSTTSTPS